MIAEPRKTTRTHDEIYHKVEQALHKADDAIHRTDLMTLTMERVELKVDTLIKTVGDTREDNDGHLVGTGLLGSILRLTFRVDDRFRLYDKWVALAVGFSFAFIPLGGVVWWLISDKLDGLLR